MAYLPDIRSKANNLSRDQLQGLINGVTQPHKGINDAFLGTDAQDYQRSNLSPEQMPVQNQLINAAQNRGAGGAFGESADYYRDLLSNESADQEAFANPELRRFHEQILPDIAEQFAGMGSGALSSSGFRNSAVNAGADLSERLGAMRANLRQRGAEGLQNIGNQSLRPTNENIHTPAEPGAVQNFLNGVSNGAGKAATAYVSGKVGAPPITPTQG